MSKSNSPLSSQYVNGVYIPSALLIAGVALTKKEWLPFAAIIAILLGVWKVYSNRMYYDFLQAKAKTRIVETRKVLKPDIYQEFPLKEKTVLSHNVAMYVGLSVAPNPPV